MKEYSVAVKIFIMPILKIFSILHPPTSPSFLNLAVCSEMLKGQCYQWIKGFEPTTPISYFNTELMRHVSLAQRIGKKWYYILFTHFMQKIMYK